MQRIIIIDNYDSFTYNVLHYLAEVVEDHNEILIFRNDELTIEEILLLEPSHLIISPGPCTPNEAGICLELIKKASPTIPILGICLGHQSIAQAFGAIVARAKSAMHGKTSLVYHTNSSIFSSLPSPLTATRYHSLAVIRDSLPKDLEVLAETEDGEIMALFHKRMPHLIGVQFHPESIMTEKGKELLLNFLKLRAD